MRTRAVLALPVLAVSLTGCSALEEDQTVRDAEGEVQEGGDVDAFALQLGDCLRQPGTDEFAEVTAVPCDEPHENQVYAIFDVESAGTYPGPEAVGALADEGCLERFASFVGVDVQQSGYAVQSLVPTEETWNLQGDREVVCLLASPDGVPLVGDAEGSGR